MNSMMNSMNEWENILNEKWMKMNKREEKKKKKRKQEKIWVDGGDQLPQPVQSCLFQVCQTLSGYDCMTVLHRQAKQFSLFFIACMVDVLVAVLRFNAG